MKLFMETDWIKFKEYAIRDAEICLLYTETMIHLYNEETGRFKLPITLTQIGVDLIQQHWKKTGIDPLEIVGKEEVRERYFSKKNNRYIIKKRLYLRKIYTESLILLLSVITAVEMNNFGLVPVIMMFGMIMI